METWQIILLCVGCVVLAAVLTFLVMKVIASNQEKNAGSKAKSIVEQASDNARKTLEEANEKARKTLDDAKEKYRVIVDDASSKAESITRKAEQEGKHSINDYKREVEQDLKERKIQLAAQENKVNQREQNIDRRDLALIEREKQIEKKIEVIEEKIKEVEKKDLLAQEKLDSIEHEIEKVASMTAEQAKEELFRRVEDKTKQEMTAYIKQQEEEAKETVEQRVKDLLGFAVDKYAQEVVSERTISTVSLPSDEMKGRIIGREGRNIRTIEQLTGVDIIIDDTPEVITVSCFDPIRRETARLALEYLIKDGRIQPGRIEEVVEKARMDVQKSTHEAGLNAAFKLGLPRINKDLLDFVGRLRYRTSYGQNVLDHSIQVAYLAGIMASELGLDANLARRAGLLHDVGKAADFEQDGSHVEIGVKLAKKYGEPDVVINAIESHHGDCEANCIISHLVAAADTLSAARPGARSETLENYIQRIEKLEEVCKSFEGVQSSFAMQSGREVRVMVVPEKISDLQAYQLARDIRDKIETEMTYPGQIKVSVVREVRATEVAK
ncbi:MAG: ribonuclease Y [Bacillales bacterium]|nr:ribonuclease Y [Bacillales bacterium]